MKITLLFSFIIILFSLVTCKHVSDPLVDENRLDILVKDKNNNTLSGVGLHFYMELVPMNSTQTEISNVQSIENSIGILTPSETQLQQNYPNRSVCAGDGRNRSGNSSAGNISYF